MFREINCKPPCVLVDFNPISVLLRAAVLAIDSSTKFKFLVPELTDGVPTMMDQTFYFLCPPCANSGREKILGFLKEAKRRSRLADVIFPENESFWSGLLFEAEFETEHDSVKIVGPTDGFIGPGDYLRSLVSSCPERADELFSKADELFHLSHVALPPLLASIASRGNHIRFFTMGKIAGALAQDGLDVLRYEYDYFVDRKASSPTPKVHLEPNVKQLKIVECDGIAAARQKIPDIDIAVTSRQLLIRTTDSQGLIQILGPENANLDSSSGAVLAPKSMLHIASLLLQGQNLSLC